MVQLWPGVPPEVLCDMYLNSCLNEGLNLLIRHHMAKGHRIDGWIRNGCFDCVTLVEDIASLEAEMKRRGKDWGYHLDMRDGIIISNYHKSESYKLLELLDNLIIFKNKFEISKNPVKLAAKCRSCRYRQTRCKGKETCEDRLKARGMI